MDLPLTGDRPAVLTQQVRSFLGCRIDTQVRNICTAPLQTAIQSQTNWNDGELVLLEPSARMHLGIRRLFRRRASQSHRPGKADTTGGLSIPDPRDHHHATAQLCYLHSPAVYGERDLKSVVISVLTATTWLVPRVGRGTGSNVCWWLTWHVISSKYQSRQKVGVHTAHSSAEMCLTRFGFLPSTA